MIGRAAPTTEILSLSRVNQNLFKKGKASMFSHVMYLAVTLSAVSLSISKHDKLTSPNKFRYENPDYC